MLVRPLVTDMELQRSVIEANVLDRSLAGLSPTRVLTGHLTLEVSGRLAYRGETALAGLEIGHRPSKLEAAVEATDRLATVNSVRTIRSST